MLFDSNPNELINKQVVLLDLSAILHTVAFGLFDKTDYSKTDKGKDTIDLGTFRIGLLGSLNYYFNLHKNDKDTIKVICVDKPPYWRKKYIAYKAHRKKARDESDFDIGSIYQNADTIMKEIKEHFPWYVIDTPNTEADDQIAVLTKELSGKNEVIIVSADGDLKQLHKYPNVKQWSPNTKKWVKTDDPILDLMIKVLKGDPKDGIPNVYSDRDFFINKENGGPIRQKAVTKKLITEGMKTEWRPELFLDNTELVANFYRNKLLLDFDEIPKELQEQIKNCFYEQYPKAINKMNLMMFLGKVGARQLLDKLQEV